MRESELAQITFTLTYEQKDGDYEYLTVTCDDTENFLGDVCVRTKENGNKLYSFVDVFADREDVPSYFTNEETMALFNRIKAVWKEHDFFTDTKMEVVFNVVQ